MTFQLEHFRLEGLHGTRTIDIPIKDNKLILVGENGTGKSTVANFIYFFLSRQWHRMLAHQFSAISAIVNGKTINLSRSEIEFLKPASKHLERLLRSLPSSSLDELQNAVAGSDIGELLEDDRWMRTIREDLGIPTRVIVDYLNAISTDDSPLFTQHLREISKQLREDLEAQILYLPTYRRIEKDLKAIKPELLDDRDRRIHERRIRNSKREHYVELVEFGMQDVVDTINRKLARLKDARNTDYRNLTGVYLREVIEGAFGNVSVERLREIDKEILDDIFGRVGEQNLADSQKLILEQIVEAADKSDLSDKDKVVAHFLIQLDEFRKRQENNEREVVDFITICNSYLIGKILAYDSSNFELRIFQDDSKIEWSMLSSGEKQIVSLFSHIYLSDNNSYYMVIDEPELSLSITWQNQFLPSILATKRCTGLIAVTHSPFIFDNELDLYAHSLERFTEVSK